MGHKVYLWGLTLGVPFFLFFPHERKEEAPGGRNPCGG